MDPDTYPHEDEARPGKSVIWMRGLFMLLLLFAFGIAHALLWVTAVVQFLWLFFAGQSNGFLVRFGASLAIWLAQAAQFVTCASEEKPFPWSPWPPSD